MAVETRAAVEKVYSAVYMCRKDLHESKGQSPYLSFFGFPTTTKFCMPSENSANVGVGVFAEGEML